VSLPPSHTPLQALVDLYFFTAANPGQDVEAMLGAASPTFKNFIVRGLHKVRACVCVSVCVCACVCVSVCACACVLQGARIFILPTHHICSS